MLSFYELSQKMIKEAGMGMVAGMAGAPSAPQAGQQAGQKPATQQPAAQPPDPAIISLQKALTQIKDPMMKGSLTNLVNSALSQKALTGKIPATATQIKAAQTMQAYTPSKPA